MNHVKIKNLEKYKDRHGKQRIYFRDRKSKVLRVPLRGPVGSAEFWEDYNDAARGAVRIKSGHTRAKRDSVRWLVEQYYQSAAFNEMSRGYRRTRRGILEKFCEKYGEKWFAKLESKNVRKIRDSMIDRPGAANNLLKALRQVFNYAVEYGHADTNPVAAVKKLKSKNKHGFHAWTHAEIQQFEDRHPVGTKARLAMALLLHTGQRRGDVVQLGPQTYVAVSEWLNYEQEKTEKKMLTPIFNELQGIIDATITGTRTYLVTEYGKPFTSNGFGNWFRKRCDEAGLPQCSAHGLRKAAASRLAEAGCTVHEIMSITGHDSISEVQRYTKAAEQKRLAGRVKEIIDGQR